MMIDPQDEAFRYGRGVFETVLVVGDKPLLWNEHLESMGEAAQALGLNPNMIQPASGSGRAAPGKSGLWRWYLTPAQFFTTWEEGLPPLPASARLGLSRLRVSSESWQARYKTLSYLLQIQARNESVCGWDVLLNERGQLAGVTMANLFWVSDGKVFTPAWQAGCRRGAVRQWILQNARQVMEREDGPDVLDRADEIFITNSRVGILPVVSWQERHLDIGPLTREWMQRFDRLCRE